jgi:type I site-specific restriction-modification system R (restriction) subunit
MKEQTIAAYETLSEAEQDTYITTLTDLNEGFAEFDAKEHVILEDMAKLVRETERKMTLMERSDAEDKERAQEVVTAEKSFEA